MLARATLLLLLGVSTHLASALQLPYSATTHCLTPRAAAVTMMAGFGGAAAPSKKKAGAKKGKKAKAPKAEGLSPKRQWDIFKELVSGGQPRHPVFARLDDNDWVEVGDVAVAAGGTAEQAAHAQKRLALEHAPRVAPKLALRAKDLVLGVAEKEGDEVVLVKKPAEVLPEGVACGFEGRPDSSGMYRKIGQTTANSDPTAILGKNFENKA